MLQDTSLNLLKVMLEQSHYSDFRKIEFSGEEILPGEKSRVNFNVGNLPTGAKVSIQLEVFRSVHPGPHVLLIGGVHGDEINGVEIVRRTLASNLFDRLVAGSVIVVPLLNVYGFINFSREVPDGKDVNRSFPGSKSGSLASRVARIITKNIIPQIDLLMDCHSGGQGKYNYPQVRVSKDDEDSLKLAKAFNAPFIIQKGVLRGSLRKVAKVNQKPCIVYEGGEALRLDSYPIAMGVSGIEKTLHFLKMIEGDFAEVKSPVDIQHTSWVRASKAGLFVWSECSGAKVRKGDVLGRIYDPYGTSHVLVNASMDGYILGHTNAPLVNQGDALFHLGI
jgi:predicted deacylase